GYREFGSDNRSGSCNVDVICPDGDGWRGEIPSVAAISTGGSLFCSGFMVNNTAQDTTPYFMTAYHCGISAGNAASLVTYWNYETDSCGGARNGSLNQFQTGSFFRSRWSTSDFALVEMDSDPDPAWGVTFAGWNRSGAEATTAVAIHHPSVDEKAISFEFDATTTTSYLGTSVPGNGTHVRVADWDTGTTEGGSSGSPLFNQNHQVIGQLHGGYAACGNNSADWYGKFSVSWNGGGTSSTRLSTWLDPGNTGANSVNTLVVGGCSNNGDCDDGAFCNGAETCGGGGSCQPGNDPCPGQACNESNDSCEPLVCNNDGTCDAGEDCNNCGDDCISGTGVSCGDGVCETAAGEDCFSCPSDCNGKTNGNPNNRYCCGNGTPCTDSRCSNNGNICTTSGGGMSYCCGDMACQGDENNSNCSIDCGPPPVCGDNVCDVGAGEDCASCAADCCGSCDPVGTSCIDDSDCCSNKCKGPSGGKTCK
ncbi:MAG: trypsin-like peptidase domain-containing protein, partial [Acidobacteriota bacterium]|nr:trypsin-like peptidase domain-containing protein [Acidobacteriota bacterium]